MSTIDRVRVRVILRVGAAVLALGAACSSAKNDSCNPGQPGVCDAGSVCEAVEGGGGRCFAPLFISGRAFDLSSAVTASSGLPSARIVALDPNGSPTSAAATSGINGAYELQVPAARRADGSPASASVTLRADRAGYEPFPSGVRQALPIELATATLVNGRWTLSSSLTDVGLLPVTAGAGAASVHGRIVLPPGAPGAIVVVEVGSEGHTAIADFTGTYASFNLPAGAAQVKGYVAGYNYAPVAVTLSAGTDTAVPDLLSSGSTTATASGSVQVVNPGQGSMTSVVLVVKSTFDPNVVRGATPPGLRAGNVSSAFSIPGVPDGEYYALAAFENDYLVRDESCIGNTAIPRLTVSNGVTTFSPSNSFKVTGALDVISPGANGPEAVVGDPVFKWVDDSSEDYYAVQVFDSYGAEIWNTHVPKVTGGTAQVAYAGPALRRGWTYQFRASSMRAGTCSGGGDEKIAQTEDLRGVFFVP